MCYSSEDFETGCSPLYRPNGVEGLISFSRKNRVKEDKPKSEEYNYNPLPEYLTIKKSKLHGKGLFIRKSYSARFLDKIGITHYIVRGKIVRSTLGGWINDGGKDANCVLIPTNDEGNRVKYGEQTTYTLQVCKVLTHGAELTLDYSKWMWILDGSLYPPDIGLNVSSEIADKILQKYLLYSKLNEPKVFFSPHMVEAALKTPDVKSVNMPQESTFETKLTEFGESLINKQKPSDIFIPEKEVDNLIIEEYIGAPGGEEVEFNKAYTNIYIQNGKYTASEVVYLMGKVYDRDYGTV